MDCVSIENRQETNETSTDISHAVRLTQYATPNYNLNMYIYIHVINKKYKSWIYCNICLLQFLKRIYISYRFGTLRNMKVQLLIYVYIIYVWIMIQLFCIDQKHGKGLRRHIYLGWTCLCLILTCSSFGWVENSTQIVWRRLCIECDEVFFVFFLLGAVICLVIELCHKSICLWILECVYKLDVRSSKGWLIVVFAHNFSQHQNMMNLFIP